MMCRASHSLSLTNDDDVVPLCEIKAAGKETQRRKERKRKGKKVDVFEWMKKKPF